MPSISLRRKKFSLTSMLDIDRSGSASQSLTVPSDTDTADGTRRNGSRRGRTRSPNKDKDGNTGKPTSRSPAKEVSGRKSSEERGSVIRSRGGSMVSLYNKFRSSGELSDDQRKAGQGSRAPAVKAQTSPSVSPAVSSPLASTPLDDAAVDAALAEEAPKLSLDLPSPRIPKISVVSDGPEIAAGENPVKQDSQTGSSSGSQDSDHEPARDSVETGKYCPGTSAGACTGPVPDLDTTLTTAETTGSDNLSPAPTTSGANSGGSSDEGAGNSSGSAAGASRSTGDAFFSFVTSSRQNRHKQQPSTATVGSQSSGEKKTSMFSFESTSTSLKAMLRRRTVSKLSFSPSDTPEAADSSAGASGGPSTGGATGAETPPLAASDVSSSGSNTVQTTSVDGDVVGDMESPTKDSAAAMAAPASRPLYMRSRSNQSQERISREQFAGRPRSRTVNDTLGSPTSPQGLAGDDPTSRGNIVPLRKENETPREYLDRLQQVFQKSQLATILSRRDEEFYRSALREFINSFDFADDPLDMALRRFLMYVRLPKETQQIDRVLDAFSSVYYDQNPLIFVDAEVAYVIVFSLVILHTDFFNKNNKHKMQKPEYVRNTFARGVPSYVLECFYDNITYTPFIHTDEDVTSLAGRQQRGLTKSSLRPNKGLLDPYSLLLDGRLDMLRPHLGETKDDPYEFVPIESREQFLELRKQFIYGPVLQLVSQRSRPEAFMFPNDTTDPQFSDPGIVEIKAVKIGTLHRQEARRVLSKTTWRECGAILTASHLYLFKDVTWLKNAVLSQPAASASSESLDGTAEEAPTTIRVAMSDFNANLDLVTTDMGAMLSAGDSPSNQQHTFLLATRGGSQEWFAASNAEELTDWLLKINFAASFSTFNVGIHGVRNLDHNHGVGLLGQHSGSLAAMSDSSLSIHSGATDVLDFAHQKSKEYGEYHSFRVEVVSQKLEELAAKQAHIEDELEENLSTIRHLKLLAPIQQKSREAVILAAGRLSAKLEWHWLERKRLLSYKDMLEHELQAELELCEHFESQRSMHFRTLLSRKSATRVPQAPSSPTAAAHRLGSEHTLSSAHASAQGSPVSSARSSIVGAPLKSVSSSRAGDDNSRLSPVSSDSVYVDAGSIMSSPKVSTSDRSSSPPKSAAASPIVRNKKNIRLSLRDKPRTRDRGPAPDGEDKVQRSASLMRAAKGDFTLHGKKFSVVEVNPEFAATPNHQRTASQTIHHRPSDLVPSKSPAGPTTDDAVPETAT